MSIKIISFLDMELLTEYPMAILSNKQDDREEYLKNLKRKILYYAEKIKNEKK